MKVLILAIFIVICASRTNDMSATVSWYPSEYTTTEYTTVATTTSEMTTTKYITVATTTTEYSTTDTTTTEYTTVPTTTPEKTTTEYTTTDTTTTEYTTAATTTSEKTTTDYTTTDTTTTEYTTAPTTTSESTTTDYKTTDTTTTEYTTVPTTTSEKTTTDYTTTDTTTTEYTTAATTTSESTTTELDSIPDLHVYGACTDINDILPGVYLIQANNDVEPFEVYCDIVDGKKWTVIQRRFNDSVDFYRNYANYTMGFGPIASNHWLGLEKTYQLTKNGDHELRVELEAYNLAKAHAQYSTFKLDSAESGFKLTISGYKGNAGHSMDSSNGMKFSTFDKDQDMTTTNCAKFYHGAWWYNHCSVSNLNGRYFNMAKHDFESMHWADFLSWYSLKTARMMIRRK